jgi:hypothetical protein
MLNKTGAAKGFKTQFADAHGGLADSNQLI